MAEQQHGHGQDTTAGGLATAGGGINGNGNGNGNGENAAELARLRGQIDRIDREILALLEQRAATAGEIGRVKHDAGAPVWRPEREVAVIGGLQAANREAGGRLPDASITAIWREIMSACRALERPETVAFLGPQGTFSELAMRARFGDGVRGLPCASIDEVFRATEAGAADYGVVPVENSTEGAVSRTLDLYLNTPLQIVAEVAIPVVHHLLTKSGAMDGVTRVCAHPQALAQCTGWLNANHPRLERVPVASNAEGARLAAEDPTVAAIAGDAAVAAWGLEPVAQAIQDDPSNRTRFQVIGQQRCLRSGRDQTSLILSVPDEAGAVHAMIEPLARHGVSMKRFESRPAREGSAWTYVFHIDVLGHRDDAPVAAALAELGQRARLCKIVGSYPRAD